MNLKRTCWFELTFLGRWRTHPMLQCCRSHCFNSPGVRLHVFLLLSFVSRTHLLLCFAYILKGPLVWVDGILPLMVNSSHKGCLAWAPCEPGRSVCCVLFLVNPLLGTHPCQTSAVCPSLQNLCCVRFLAESLLSTFSYQTSVSRPP